MAEANKQKSMLEANGTAEGIMIKGDADAFSVESQAKAKAEVMAVKADAWRDYQKAAKISMWLDAMPKMAAEVAAPLSQVRKRIVLVFLQIEKRLHNISNVRSDTYPHKEKDGIQCLSHGPDQLAELASYLLHLHEPLKLSLLRAGHI